MDPEYVSELIDEFVADLAPDVRRPVPPTAALKDVGIDSLSLMDLLSLLERRTGVEIPDDALPEISTVQDLLDHLAAARPRV
ncbi:phosphopantetheine-binding protein [Sphaerisporangium sp. NPDC051017]|uniref:phosphopantetheine-binding protein n=1 Tax=Sphaerisporangium sp. NPDC051017 TaxID=3154636 RepID=UPI003435C6C8